MPALKQNKKRFQKPNYESQDFKRLGIDKKQKSLEDFVGD